MLLSNAATTTQQPAARVCWCLVEGRSPATLFGSTRGNRLWVTAFGGRELPTATVVAVAIAPGYTGASTRPRRMTRNAVFIPTALAAAVVITASTATSTAAAAVTVAVSASVIVSATATATVTAPHRRRYHRRGHRSSHCTHSFRSLLPRD